MRKANGDLRKRPRRWSTVESTEEGDVILYQVTYPDERRGPNERSTALFRTEEWARSFARRLRGRVDTMLVTESEFRQMVRKSLV